MVIFSFVLFLIFFTIVGLSSILHNKHTKADYYLADRNIAPWLVGLSAVATNNSGYMFIGVIGYTYSTGLASIWLMTGWLIGDFLASTFIHKRLRHAAEKTKENSYTGALANWNFRCPRAQKLFAAISVLFLLSYASAQLLAGSKALFVLFDWPQWAGSVLGAGIVVAYCYAGGIRASIWTDAAQSFVMIIAMGLLLFTAVSHLGGIGAAHTAMSQIPGFLDWFPKDLALPGLAGGLLFILGWLFAGFSVAGQPHIMVRFMTLDKPEHFTKSRIWYYTWFTLFYAAATGVGLLSRVYLNDTAMFDAELALPTLAMELLHPFLVGVILAGLFAATMSTADSLILSCSAAFTHDLIPHKIEKQWIIKITTVLTTAAALAFALTSKETVFSLVILSWSCMASSFCPILIVYALGKRPSEKVMTIMALTGLSAALLWRWAGWHNAVYEGMPAILLATAIYWILPGKKKKSTPLKPQNHHQLP